MPGRQASFGGVAALFGDDDDNANVVSNNSYSGPSSGQKARQASFGGVATLFGDDNADDDLAGPASTSTSSSSNANPAARKAQRAPSFGGVAGLFSGDDNDNDEVGSVPSASVSAPAGRKAQQRQPSFGGVAALFGDDDDEAANVTADDDDLGGPAPVPQATSNQSQAQQPQQKKKRDPSFSGVADLFGDDNDDFEQTKPESSNQNTYEEEEQQAEGIGDLQALPQKSTSRPKKRDPSFGGVANLFAMDEDEEEEDESNENEEKPQKIQIETKPNVQNKKTTELQIQVEEYRSKCDVIEEELKAAKDENEKFEARIRDLVDERQSLVDSKLRLIVQTAQEIDRMRSVISEMDAQYKMEQQRAATVG